MIDAANLRTVVRVLRIGQGTEFLEGNFSPGGNMEVERLDRDQWREYAGGIVAFLSPQVRAAESRSYGGPWRFLDTI